MFDPGAIDDEQMAVATVCLQIDVGTGPLPVGGRQGGLRQTKGCWLMEVFNFLPSKYLLHQT